MSETIVRVVLPSGNHALYSVQPQHLPRESVQQSYQWPSMYGQQLAVRINGDWFKPGLREKMLDQDACNSIELWGTEKCH
jgi:hypothetical protein